MRVSEETKQASEIDLDMTEMWLIRKKKKERRQNLPVSKMRGHITTNSTDIKVDSKETL